jgi:hypothetical protein
VRSPFDQRDGVRQNEDAESIRILIRVDDLEAGLPCFFLFTASSVSNKKKSACPAARIALSLSICQLFYAIYF